MKLMRTALLIALAVALAPMMFASTAEAAVITKLEVATPDSGGIRGIDSLITVNMKFFTGSNDKTLITPYLWLADPPAGDPPYRGNTGLVADGDNSDAEDNVGFAFDNRANLAVSPTAGQSIVVARYKLDGTGTTGDLNTVDWAGKATGIALTPQPIVVQGLAGFIWTMTFTIKVGPDIGTDAAVSLYASVMDVNEQELTPTNPADYKNGFSAVAVARVAGAGDLVFNPPAGTAPRYTRFAVDGDRPQRGTLSYRQIGATTDTVATRGERIVHDFDNGQAYPALSVGDTVDIGYFLGTAQDSVLAFDWKLMAQLYYGTEADFDTVTVGVLFPEQIADAARIIMDPLGAATGTAYPMQTPLIRDLTPADRPSILGLFLADAAGNLSSEDKDDPVPTGLTRSVDFVIDLKPPDLTEPELRTTGKDTVIVPMDGALVTDGDTGIYGGITAIADLNPIIYDLTSLEYLASLEFAFADKNSSQPPEVAVGGGTGGCVTGPCGEDMPAPVIAPTGFAFDAAFGIYQNDMDAVTFNKIELTPGYLSTVPFGGNAWGDSAGVYDLWVRAEDLAGNVGPLLTRQDVRLDAIEPAYTELFPLSCTLVDTIDEDLSTVKFRLTEKMASAWVTFHKVSGTDDRDKRQYTLSAAELAETARQSFAFVDSLVDETTYWLEVVGRDTTGNFGIEGSGAVTYRFDTEYDVPRVQRFVVQVDNTSLIAGQTATLTITACDSTRRAIGYEDAFTAGSPILTVNGDEGKVTINDSVTVRLTLDGGGWVCGQRQVTVKNILALDTLVATIVDSTVYDAEAGPFVTGVSDSIKYVPDFYHHIVVAGPDTVVQGEQFALTVTLVDQFGNRRLNDARYVTLSTEQLGIEVPTGDQYIASGQRTVYAKSMGYVGNNLTFRAKDLVEGNNWVGPAQGVSNSIVVLPASASVAVDAPDTLIAQDYMGALGTGDQGGFVMLTWDLSDDHNALTGYRIYRQMMVDYVPGGDGEDALVMDPQETWVPWGSADAVPGETVGRAIVATLDNQATFWAIAAERGMSTSAATAKEAFDGEQTPATAYELMAETMVESKKALEADGPQFATLTPEALAYIETGVVPQLRVVDNMILSTRIPSAEAVAGVDNIAPEAVVAVRAMDTPSDVGGSISLNWTKSVSDALVSRTAAAAVGPGSLSDQIPGVLGYNIYRRIGDGEWSLVGKASGGETSFADETAFNGVHYTYEIRPYDADNEASAIVTASAMAIRNNVFDVNGQPLYGLFGMDNEVGFDDFFIFADQFGLTASDEGFEPAFDLVADAAIGFEDFFVFADNFGRKADVASKVIPTLVGVNTDTRLSLATGEELPRAGGEVAVDVELTDFVEFKGYGLSLTYDPTHLEFVKVASESDLLGAGPFAQPTVIAENEGEISVVGYGDTALEGALDLSLVFRTKGEIENTYIDVAQSEVRDGAYMVNQVALPAPVTIQTRPEAFALHNNYPNPFNPATSIKYALADAGYVQLEVFNAVGQKVRTLVADTQRAGRYVVQWDATNDSGQALSSGMYFYRLQAGSDFLDVRKMLLLK